MLINEEEIINLSFKANFS